jgi:hypothetical protein
LAYDPAGTNCLSCDAQHECSAKVMADRPALLRYLSKFQQSNGETLDFCWMESQEARAKRKQIKEARKVEAEQALYGCASVIEDVRSRLRDKRAHPLLDKMSRRGFNPVSDAFDALARFSTEMAAIINALRKQPQTAGELTAFVEAQCGLSASRASRITYSLLAILEACERISKDNWKVSLNDTPTA